MLRNVVRSVLLGVAFLPVVVLVVLVAALVLGVFLGSALAVLLMLWNAVVGGPGPMIFALLCAGPICMAALWGWISGSGGPGSELIREDVRQEPVWDATTGSTIVTPPDGGVFWMILLSTIVLEFIVYAALDAAFNLPEISGSLFFLAGSLVVAVIVKYVVEAVAARRRRSSTTGFKPYVSPTPKAVEPNK